MPRLILIALLVPLAACPFGGGATTCSTNLAAVMNAAQGSVTDRDGGIDVLVTWAADAGLPEPYLNRTTVQSSTRNVTVDRKIVSPTSIEVGVQVFGRPEDGGVAFSLTFADPDRNGLPGCTGSHGGMEDVIVLGVNVSDANDAGVRVVSASAGVSLGAF